MLNLKVADVRAFLPAKDFAISKAFYTGVLIHFAQWIRR
jgi:hypothetical protein